MNTKTCRKCGWVYPITQRGTKCPLCGEPFVEVVCSVCGRVVSGKDRVCTLMLCRDCHNARERQHMIKYTHKRNARFDERYENWIEQIQQIPKDYPTLTEEQWLRACRHFNGCAWCGSSEIDTRSFFMDLSVGGRYCEWNIVPQCSTCSRLVSTKFNPFRTSFKRDNNGRVNIYRDCVDRIVEYLQPLVQKGIEYGRKD